MQIFFEQERIHMVRIVTRNGFDYVESAALIEGQSRNVVHGGLKANQAAIGGAQARFSKIQQGGADAMAARLGADVNGDNMPDSSAAFGNEKPKNLEAALLRLFARFYGRFCDQRKRIRAADIASQFVLAIRDSRREAGLINRPESVEILAAVVADCESHFLILDGHESGRRKLNTIKYIRWLGKF